MNIDTNFGYYTASPDKTMNCQDWSNSLPAWEITPDTIDVPMWQYTNLADQPISYSCYSTASPALSYSQPASSIPSTMPSPNMASYLDEPRSVPSARTSPYQESADDDLLDDDDDVSDYSWSANSEPRSSAPRKSSAKKNELASKASVRNAKKAHTVVERNYRERLNDKIADLGLYLFETSSDSRTKPSKSLVMTRAKERLQQLESRNKSLESEVIKLRQQIAILEHMNGGVKH